MSAKTIFLVLILFQGTYAIVCPNGYGAYNNACEKCFDPECKSCGRIGPSEQYQTCTSCISGFYLNDRTCDPCADTGCAECSGGTSGTCLTCKSGYTKDGNICKPCDVQGCGSCDGDTTTCSACAADYYMDNNQCVSCGPYKSSPPGSTSASACITCGDSYCKSCSGVTGPGKCQTCNPTYFLTSSSTCQKCNDANCLACSGSGLKQCITCAANYDDFNRECTHCPAGMTSEPGGFCQGCGGEGCQICDPVITAQCTKCLPNYYLEGTQCVGCGDGKYPSDSSNGGTSSIYCLDCDVAHCKSCTGPGTGLGVCTSCKNGYFLNGAGACIPCDDEGCTACSWAGEKQCLSCQGGYYLKDNECVSCGKGVSSDPGATDVKGCYTTASSMETIGSSSNSNATVIFVVAAIAGVFLALAITFIYKRTRLFKLKRASSISSVGIDLQDAPQTPEINEKKYRKSESGNLRYAFDE